MLIAQVLSITYEAACHTNADAEPFVLCPLSVEDTIFIERLCYTELLNNSLEVYDAFGYTMPVQDGKRVINFGKMSIHEAIAICEHIVNKDPIGYPCIKAWLTAIKQ